MKLTAYRFFNKRKFPSPTGVNYYESVNREIERARKKKEFPSPTGVNYYEYLHAIMMKGSGEMFPSPTGVNYYE